VVLEVGLFAESPTTDVTLEWPGSVVDEHVTAEVPGGRERLGARGAFVGLFLKQKRHQQFNKSSIQELANLYIVFYMLILDLKLVS
jgi:hypothetical protein